MFADPQTATVNAVAKAMQKINQDKYSSEYLLITALDEFRMHIRNTSAVNKRRGVVVNRHNVELVHTVYPVAPATLPTIRKVYFVIENQQGDTLVDPTYVASALFAWATASSNANITKLMNFES